MNFDAAMREHADYKVKLVLYLNDSCSLDEKRLSRPSYCSLGLWLRQSSKQYNNFQEFNDVVTVHKRFHSIVGEILALINEGKRYEAREALKLNGIFSDITTELNQKLILLKRRFAKIA